MEMKTPWQEESAAREKLVEVPGSIMAEWKRW